MISSAAAVSREACVARDASDPLALFAIVLSFLTA